MDLPRRDSLTEELFAPAAVRAYQSLVNRALIDELRAEEHAAIAPMVETRRAEFATARACARSALAEFGVDAAIPRQALALRPGRWVWQGPSAIRGATASPLPEPVHTRLVLTSN